MRRPGICRRGQIIVKMPALLVLFMGMGAFAVDLGFYHLKKAQAQTAAEACAFAAGYRAASGYDSSSTRGAIEAATSDLGDLNAPGCSEVLYEWGRWTSESYAGQPAGFVPVPDGDMASALRVTVTMKYPRFFELFFNPTERVVKSRATVVWTPFGDVWPMCVQSTTPMPPNGDITFGPDSPNIVPGNKGWLGFNGGNNTPDLEVYLGGGPYNDSTPSPWETSDALNQTSSGAFTLRNGLSGASIPIEGTPGLKMGTQDEVEAYVEAQVIVLVPIWDTIQPQGADAVYQIVGLLPVQLIRFTDARDGLRIEGKILPDGPYWFMPNSNVSLNMQARFVPAATVTMVE